MPQNPAMRGTASAAMVQRMRHARECRPREASRGRRMGARGCCMVPIFRAFGCEREPPGRARRQWGNRQLPMSRARRQNGGTPHRKSGLSGTCMKRKNPCVCGGMTTMGKQYLSLRRTPVSGVNVPFRHSDARPSLRCRTPPQ
jgi:hypothetical protein